MFQVGVFGALFHDLRSTAQVILDEPGIRALVSQGSFEVFLL